MLLYDYYRSTASYRVRIALAIKKCSYTCLPVHLLNNGGEQHQLEYARINPMHLLPTLDENGRIITQSLAIIEYLNEINPDPPLLPTTPYARAKVRSIALNIACDVHPLNNLRIQKRLRTQFNASEDEITHWMHHWFLQGFTALEQMVELSKSESKSVCYGNEVTLADICLIPQVYSAKRFNFPLQKYPKVMEIYDYCIDLPAFKSAAPE